MAFNGSGTFSRLYNWVTDRDADVAITASRMDDEMDGMATGLSTCIAKDGQTTTTAAIPFAGGAVKLADGTVSAPSVSFINDTNTGAYWIAADNFSLVTQGVKILELDGDASSAATGLKITNAAAASGADLSVISSGTNENLTINAKGSGTITLNPTGTGNVRTSRAFVPASDDGAALGVSGTAFSDLFLASGGVINWNAGNATITHSASYLTVALAGTNILELDGDASSASSGLKITNSNTLGTTIAATEALSSNGKLLLEAKGSGTLSLNVTATGNIIAGQNIVPNSNDGAALGASGTAFSDLYLADGGFINWNAGDVSITQGTNSLTFAGASTGYVFDASIIPGTNDGAALGASATAFSDLFLASGGVINWNAGVTTVTQAATSFTFGGSGSYVVVMPGQRTTQATVGDDGATSIDIPPSSATQINAVVTVSMNGTPSSTVIGGSLFCRAKGASAAPVSIGWSDATNVAFTTGVLAGTTGTDGKITFSCNNDGKLYVENRLGGSRVISFTITNISSS